MELLALALTALMEFVVPECFLRWNMIEYMTQSETSVEGIAVH